MKDIIDDSNELIRSISKEVPLPLSKEDHDLLMDMHEFLVASQDEKLSEKYDLRPAVGIAAIQLGIPKRMCAIHVLDFDENGEVINSTDYALANPKIVSYTPKQSYLKTGEACLSVLEDVQGYVPRHAKITVEGYDALTEKNVKLLVQYFSDDNLQEDIAAIGITNQREKVINDDLLWIVSKMDMIECYCTGNFRNIRRMFYDLLFFLFIQKLKHALRCCRHRLYL